jgi:hypothetical protein
LAVTATQASLTEPAAAGLADAAGDVAGLAALPLAAGLAAALG